MIIDTVLPQLGLTMTEGSVLQWLKKTGEWIEKGELLFEIQTDKSDMEVEAVASGYLQVVVEPGNIVPVGTVIARIADSMEELSAAKAMAAAPLPFRTSESTKEDEALASSPNPNTTPPIGGMTVASGDMPSRRNRPTPRARRVAKDLGVDISAVEGTGPNGRIVVADIESIHRLKDLGVAAYQNTGLSAGSLTHARAGISLEQVKISQVRRVIAERMTESFQNVPHFYLNADADASELVSLKNQLSRDFKDRLGLHLTYTDLLIKALALSVAAHPDINCFWLDGSISRRNNVDVGFAAQAEEALLVPVVRNADPLSLIGLTQIRTALTDKARTGRLSPDEMNNASCTLSNLGAFRVDRFNAIINPPESIILAVGRIAKRPWVYNDEIVARFSVSLTLSVDHRVTDGVTAANFLSTMISYLESPYQLILPAQ
jgi:pyruvate dehydrogenase E2 component (dihydrolipoamide acetyltransferase)